MLRNLFFASCFLLASMLTGCSSKPTTSSSSGSSAPAVAPTKGETATKATAEEVTGADPKTLITQSLQHQVPKGKVNIMSVSEPRPVWVVDRNGKYARLFNERPQNTKNLRAAVICNVKYQIEGRPVTDRVVLIMRSKIADVVEKPTWEVENAQNDNEAATIRKDALGK